MAKLRWLGNALVFVPSDGSEPDFGEPRPAPRRLPEYRQEGHVDIPRVIQIVKVEDLGKRVLDN